MKARAGARVKAGDRVKVRVRVRISEGTRRTGPSLPFKGPANGIPVVKPSALNPAEIMRQ